MSDFCTGCGNAFRDGDRFCAKCGKARDLAAADVGKSESSTSSEGAPKAKVIVPVVLGVALSGLLPLLFLGKGCSGSTEGSVVVAGGPNRGFTFRPTGCASMQPYGRFGANLHGDGPNDGAVYVTTDPTRGPSVEVEVPGSCRNVNGTDCTVFPLPRDRCSRFEADVDFTGVTVNDVRQVEGHVAVDCALEDGTTVRGQVRFDGC